MPPPAGAETLEVGLIATLSRLVCRARPNRPKTAFTLALKQLGGKLGGMDTHLTVIDDELKPDVALTKVRTLLEREHPTFLVGADFQQRAGRDREAGDGCEDLSHQR